MGRPKPLLPWDGSTLVAWQAEQLRQAGAEDVVVVLGYEADAVRAALPEGVRPVLNRDYVLGRASSLRVGAGAVEDVVEAVVVLGVDQPRPAWVTRLLIEARRESDAAVALPRFGERRGHPVVVAGRLLPELRSAGEAERGLRAVIVRHEPETLVVACASAVVDLDLNTPAEYESAVAAYRRGDWGPPGGP
jgi:CTP:molybdopterin cytidylyltransferase MocA